MRPSSKSRYSFFPSPAILSSAVGSAAEIQEIYAADPTALDRNAGLVKTEYLLFDLGLIAAQEKAAWLVERYGPGINFASVAPADVVPVDAIRRGMLRKANFTYMTRSANQG